MKKIYFFLLLLCSDIYGFNQKVIALGIFYTRHTKQKPQPLIFHTLEVDPQLNTIVLHRAQNSPQTKRIASQAEPVYTMAQKTGALAAINGGNFRFLGRFKGTPLGLLVINKKVHADLQFLRGTIAWNNDSTPPTIAPIKIIWHLKIGNSLLPIDRVNQPRNNNEAILYTPEFKPTTMTKNTGTEIIVANNKVIDIKKKSGNNKTPDNGFVYSVGPQADIFFSLKKNNIKVGDHVEISHRAMTDLRTGNGEYAHNFQYMLSGSGLLVYNNQCATKEQLHQEFLQGIPIFGADHPHAPDYHNTKNRTWLIEKKHPRTAVGIKENGNWLFVVVEGRPKNAGTQSHGITLPDLAQLMRWLGCTHALNMDGGSCATMYVDGNIKNALSVSNLNPNNPAHTYGRAVTDAFLIFPKNWYHPKDSFAN